MILFGRAGQPCPAPGDHTVSKGYPTTVVEVTDHGDFVHILCFNGGVNVGLKEEGE